MSTMRDVARRAEVSQKTVSRVFNNDPQVRAETRERVLAAMEELAYTPNRLATAFRRGRSSVVAIAVPDLGDPYFARVIRAVDVIARRHGMSTLVASLGSEPAREREVVNTLISNTPAGLIVAPVGQEATWLDELSRAVPIVLVDRAPDGSRLDSFVSDDEGGARIAAEHLIARGHRRIAFVGDDLGLSTTRARYESFLRTMVAAGLPHDDGRTVLGVDSETSAADAIARLIRSDDAPTAVFSSNARVSMLLVPVIRGTGLEMLSFGDFPMSGCITPAISVIEQDPDTLGTRAATRVLERIRHGEPEGGPVRDVLPVALTARGDQAESGKGPECPG